MKKYNKKLINDYINGDKINDFNIDELENDKEFMMLVISLTNDKSFYKLCSDELKKDYEFVEFIVRKFQNDVKFICEVADYYLKDVKDELNRLELAIVMSNITNKKDVLKHREYEVICESIFTTKMVQIELAKNKVNDKYIQDEIGMGFLVIFDSYNSSKIVLDFYAKSIVKSIFDENDIDLEIMLHQQFESKEQLNQIGINRYLINFIEGYDSMLASYLSANIELLSEFSNKIKNIQSNWNKYNEKDERKKYNLLLEKIHEYMENNESNCMFDETTLLYYIGKKLGILDKIAKYDCIDLKTAKSIVDEIDEEFIEDTLKVSICDKMNFDNIKKIMQSIIFSKGCKAESNSSNSIKKCKILKFPYNKND